MKTRPPAAQSDRAPLRSTGSIHSLWRKFDSSRGGDIDRIQHVIQDASEHYAVFVMQKAVEAAGLSSSTLSPVLWESFSDYLEQVGLTLQDFSAGRFPKYKDNVDSQAPRFAVRLARHLKQSISFRIDEAEQRNLGKKADFFADLSTGKNIPFSLKNYIGSSGITRPQVASGTFLSFANSFVFTSVGVGKYIDPRYADGVFQGSNRAQRNGVLEHENRAYLIGPLESLEDINQHMRGIFLGPGHRFYDEPKMKAVIREIVPPAHRAVLAILEGVGLPTVKATMLARSGMDGGEEAFFFDSSRSIDSVTSPNYGLLRKRLQDDKTSLIPSISGQSLRFTFRNGNESILDVDVPFTVNTNGAWFRPNPRYEGVRQYNDKGVMVELYWGERRPRKSREIATSVNTYVDLQRAGVFERSGD